MVADPVEKVRVFISSVQNRKIEDMEAERAAVVSTVENYSPTVAWAFEYTPASDLPAEAYYLRGVQDCHLFLLLLGDQIPEAVSEEYRAAVSLKKPIFAFVKDTQRTAEAEEFLALIRKQSKYSIFQTSQEIPGLVESSLDSFILRLVEDYNQLKEYPPVMMVLADAKRAKLLCEYAQLLLRESRTSFEAEVTHYLTKVPQSQRDVSKFYIPVRAKMSGGTSETIDNLLAQHKRVVILGAAGSGKTTELLNFSARLFKHAIEETESRQMPIYVDMRLWTEGDVISHLEYIFRGYGFHFERPTVDSLLRSYKVILLFDGLDEVPTLQLSEKVAQMKYTANTYENVDIVVSCRHEEYVSDLGFPIAYLEPLQDADIIKYMGEFTKQEFNLGRFYSWPTPLRELSRHFLMLNFIANILAEGAEPTSLATVYENYINLLFDRWERGKRTKIDPVWKKMALTNLAVDMQIRSRYSVSEGEAISLLRTVLAEERVDFSSIELLNELVSSGMIKEEGGKYIFWHTSFREYLASQLVVNRIRARETISELVSDPAWEPVIVFASAMFDDSSEMSRFLFEVLDTDLYLYARCLANALSAVSSVPTLPDDELSGIILREMLEARVHIIERWLPVLLPTFRPYAHQGKGSRPAVVGRFSSEHGGHLVYGFTTQEKLGEKVRLLRDFPPGTTLKALFDVGVLSSTISKGLSVREAGVAGAHRTALEDVWEELEDIIRAKSLIEPPRLIYERTQTEVHDLAQNHIISLTIPADIPLIEVEIEKLLAGYGASQVIMRVGGEDIHLNSLLLRLKALANSGHTSIGEPLLPGPDRIPEGSNWVTQFYEDETLVRYIRLYFDHFLQGYSELVRLNFGQLSHRLKFHQLLPVRVVVEIERPAPSGSMEALGGCDYYFEPLEGTCQNEVFVSLNQKISQFASPSSDLQDAMSTWLEKLKRYGRWNSSVRVWTTEASLGKFFGEHNQIRSAIYDIAQEDLAEVFKVPTFRL